MSIDVLERSISSGQTLIQLHEQMFTFDRFSKRYWPTQPIVLLWPPVRLWCPAWELRLCRPEERRPSVQDLPLFSTLVLIWRIFLKIFDQNPVIRIYIDWDCGIQQERGVQERFDHKHSVQDFPWTRLNSQDSPQFSFLSWGFSSTFLPNFRIFLKDIFIKILVIRICSIVHDCVWDQPFISISRRHQNSDGLWDA